MNSALLGKAALSMSESLMTIENPQEEQTQTEYHRRARSHGYQGIEVGVAYYRKVWPLNTRDEVITQDILDVFLPIVEHDH